MLQAIEAWETATELILQREAILTRLETFERLASDPDRFFQRGQSGIATVFITFYNLGSFKFSV